MSGMATFLPCPHQLQNPYRFQLRFVQDFDLKLIENPYVLLAITRQYSLSLKVQRLVV